MSAPLTDVDWLIIVVAAAPMVAILVATLRLVWDERRRRR